MRICVFHRVRMLTSNMPSSPANASAIELNRKNGTAIAGDGYLHHWDIVIPPNVEHPVRLSNERTTVTAVHIPLARYYY